MTNQEAIETLKARKEHYEMGDGCEVLVEALDVAIKALENQKYEDDIKVKTPETPGSMLTLEEAIRYTNWQIEDYRELARKSFNANEREKSWKYSSRADYNHQLNLWLRELKMLKEKKEV